MTEPALIIALRKKRGAKGSAESEEKEESGREEMDYMALIQEIKSRLSRIEDKLGIKDAKEE